MTVDVVAISETTKLLLSSSIPDIEDNRSKVLRSLSAIAPPSGMIVENLNTYGGETKRVNLNPESSYVLFLKLSCQMTLDEGSLSISLAIILMMV